jgi:hypothetical protein
VRQIIVDVAPGATLYSEAKRLNDEGVPSPATGTEASLANTARAGATRL